MQATNLAPLCPVCGHDGSQSFKLSTPATEFLPADLVVPRVSKRRCDKCKTTFVPERKRDEL